MTDTRKEIDLLIRASVSGKRDLKEVPKSINDLADALERQVKAAQRGESSIDELKASLLSLEQVGATLRSGAGLLGDFERLADGIKKTEERVTRSGKAYDEYKTKLEALSTVTDKQQEKLIKLSTASDKAQATLAKQRDGYAALTKQMQEAGIATENLAESERQIRESAAQLGVVITKNKEAIASYSDTVRKARAEDKARADEAKKNADAQLAAAQNLANRKKELDKASAAASEAAARAQADAQTAALARQDRLRKNSELLAQQMAEANAAFSADNKLINQAEAAERAAKSYTTLARASKDLTPQVISFKQAIEGIITPTDKSAKSITGLEESLRGIAKSVSTIKGPVREYRDTMEQLNAAQQSITNQSQLIENFRRQTDAVKAARVEFTAARAKVLEYAEGVKQGGSAGAALSQSLVTAQARMKAASEAFARQVTEAKVLRNALNDAGISTAKLAEAEQRLVAAAQSSVSSLRSLTGAVAEYGTASEKANKNGLGSGDGERTTLNFAQRLRGQILSLTASYVGLFGAIQTARGALEALNAQDTINSKISVAIDSSDPNLVAKEYTYLRNRADYYGIGVKNLADSYGSYAIAAKSAQFSNEQTKYTFEQLTAGMRVMRLNTEQSGRAFTQLNQILGKSKPELEDIKTLAESGFAGVQGLMARGLRTIGVEGIKAGQEIQGMAKMMKDGTLGASTAIYALARQAELELGKRLPDSLKALAAEQGRFETSWFEFQKTIANSGFGAAYTKLLKDLSDFMSSEAGSDLAKSASKFFATFAEALILVLKNLDLVKAAAITFVAIWSANMFAGAIVGLISLAAGVDVVTASLALARKAVALFAVAIAAFEGASYLIEKFDIMRQASINFTAGLQKTWVVISDSFLAAIEVLPVYFKNIFAQVINLAGAQVRSLAGILGSLAKSVGLDSVADALLNVVTTVELKTESTDAIIARRRAALAADLARIDKQAASDLAAFRGTAGGVKLAPRTNTPSADGGRPNDNLPEDDKKAEAAAKKRAAAIEEITKALEGLDARTDKAQSDSLQAQIDAVDTQYAALARRISKLGGKEGAEFAKQFAEGMVSLKGQITEKFNKKLVDEQMAVQKKLEDVDAAAGRRNKTELDARLKAVDDRYAETYRNIATLEKNLATNGRDTGVAAQMKTRLDAGVAEIKQLETKKYYQDELTRREQQVNDLIQTRSSALTTIKAQEEAGLLTTEQANQARRDTIAQLQPQIEALAASGQVFASSIDAAFDPIKIQQFIAQLNLAVASSGRLNKNFELTAAQVNDKLATGASNALGSITDELVKAREGTQSWGEALENTAKNFLQFAADFLREIAVMIAKQLLLKAIENTGWGAGISGLVNGAVQHEGGVVGSVSNRTRSVSPALFANAPRYHSGGMPGLASNEYTAILKKNEEVLNENDPRNILNGGLTPAAGGGGDAGTRIVLVDDQRKVQEYLESAEGSKSFVTYVRKNAPTIKMALGVK